MTKNVAESKRVAGSIHAELRNCWGNAVKLIYELPEYSQATYVEGVSVLAKRATFPKQHGWVERDGEIIDPTHPEKDLRYFPALRWLGMIEILAMQSKYNLPFYKSPVHTADAICPAIEAAWSSAQEWLDNRHE